jgi:DNA-binding HxlR family transcriptional regulator
MTHSSTPAIEPVAFTARTGCSVAKALDVIGSRSTLLLMREAFYGTRRFDEFAVRVGISEAAAAARLRELVAVGLLSKTPYQEAGSRTRMEYVLTNKGRDLLPAILALMQWGDAWAADDGGPVQLEHRDCGSPVSVEIRCADGHQLTGGDLRASLRT